MHAPICEIHSVRWNDAQIAHNTDLIETKNREKTLVHAQGVRICALNFVKRGAVDTPSAKPVLNIHILLFHTPHPQRNGARAYARASFRIFILFYVYDFCLGAVCFT